MFNQYLNVIVNSSALVHSPELVDFLKLPYDQFLQSKVEIARCIPQPHKFSLNGKSKSVPELTLPKGVAELKFDKETRQFSKTITGSAIEAYNLITDMIDACRNINTHNREVSNGYHQLALKSLKLSQVYRGVSQNLNFEPARQIQEVYETLNIAFDEYSKSISKDIKSFEHNIEHMFTFSLKELEGLDDLLMERNMFAENFRKSKEALDIRKAKLLDLRDLKKWEIDQERLQIPKIELLNSPILSKAYMLPKETKDLENLKDFWGLFNSQVEKETQEYCRLKFMRVAEHLNNYVSELNQRINTNMSVFIDLHTKINLFC